MQMLASNSAGSSNPVTLAVGVAPAATTPVITSSHTVSGQVGVAFAGYTITAIPAATAFVATGLPAGLSLNSTTGAIAGTPAQSGAFDVTISANNASGAGAPVTLVITIRPSVQLVVPGS